MFEIDCGDSAATVTYDDYLSRMFNSLPIVEVEEEESMTEKEVADFVTEQAQKCGLTPRQWTVRLNRISPIDIAKGMWKIEREAHIVTKAALGVAEESLATAERDRDRWMAVHAREWDVEVYPIGECSIFDPKEKYGIYQIVDSAPTLEAALDAAFALFPLGPKAGL